MSRTIINQNVAYVVGAWFALSLGLPILTEGFPLGPHRQQGPLLLYFAFQNNAGFNEVTRFQVSPGFPTQHAGSADQGCITIDDARTQLVTI